MCCHGIPDKPFQPLVLPGKGNESIVIYVNDKELAILTAFHIQSRCFLDSSGEVEVVIG